ncbi:MAG TPA: acyl-CoA thioesterase [Flavobacterium sp.]|uniref:acyl-CoA thioesterase n=1 Tax=Flavobacterium sp. TaxID=239 RepID=UPI002F3E402D
MSSFKHKVEIQVRFKDLDMMGHVNNANYFTYVEYARLQYFDSVVGVNTDWHSQKGLIMAHFDIDFRQAISFEDKINVHTRCSRLGTKSFDLSWKITKNTDDNSTEEIVAEGKAVIACYDYDLKKAKEIPADRRKLIEHFENMEETSANTV